MKNTAPGTSPRDWLAFRRDTSAQLGLWLVVVLYIITALAPFLAENKPILRLDEKGWSAPLFRSLAPIEWRFLFYGAAVGALFFLRKKISRKTLVGIALLAVVGTELFCLNQKPFLDAVDYKNTPAQGELWPAIRYGPYEQTDQNFASPSSEHWLGTDALGRDIASRMLHGGQISLSVGFVSVLLSMSIGVLLGTVAGYFRGGCDLALSRLVEVMECFPTFFLILSVIAFLPPSLLNIMLVIGITSWTGVARLVRAEVLRLSVQPFTLAAQATGAGDLRVIGRHVLPNALGPILVTATFGVASSILVESSLSFLGFGVQPPTPTWGDILSEARQSIDFAWWLATFPGLAIFITITAYNLVGEGLRDAFDPKLKE